MLHAIVLPLLLALPAASPQESQGSAPASRPESQSADPAAKRALATELERLGRKAEAIRAWEEAYALDGTLESGLGWGRALAADARFNDALRALDAVAEKHRNDKRIHLAFAETFAARAEARRAEARERGFDELGVVASEYEAAARAVEDAIRLDPKDLSLHFLLHRYFVSAGLCEAAIEAAVDARKKHPDSWEVALCEGDARVAELAKEQRLRLAPNADEEVKRDRAEMLAAAEAAFAAAAKLAPARPEPRQRQGYLVLVTGGEKDRPVALEQYAAALALDPARTDVSTLLQALSAKEILPFFERALADWRKAHPDARPEGTEDAPLHWYLGYAKYVNDDRKGAEEEYKLVVRKTPADYSARYYLGKIAYFEKRWKDATEQFDVIAQKSPAELAALGRADAMFTPIMQGLVEKLIVGDNSGAQVTAVSGNPALESAIRLQRAIVELDPNNAREWNNLGLFYRDAGKPKQALDSYRRALELAPRDPRVLNDTAVVYHYYLRTDDAEAKRLYELSIQLAKEVIASKSASIPQKEDARSALQDAEGNLAKLLRGSRKND